jgi:hypothetical protein
MLTLVAIDWTHVIGCECHAAFRAHDCNPHTR